MTDFNSAEGGEVIVEIPSGLDIGKYTLVVAENATDSGTYDTSLAQEDGTTTVVVKVTSGGEGLKNTGSSINVKLVQV